MNDDMDLDLSNYELPELLDLFKLNYEFTQNDLKQAKKIVLKTHPDKSGLDKKYFLFFSSAYKVVYSLYEFRTRSNSQRSTEYVIEKDKETEDLMKQIANKPNFNKIFNELFEKHIVSEAEETGYGSWLTSNEDIDTRTTTRAEMNGAFEQKKNELSALVKREDIKECGGEGHSEITGDVPESYGSALFSNLQYEDLKKAHVESVVPVTAKDFEDKPKYNEQTLRTHRETQDTTPISLDQSNQYLNNKKDLNNKVDMQRAFKLAKQDEENRILNQNWIGSFKQLTEG